MTKRICYFLVLGLLFVDLALAQQQTRISGQITDDLEHPLEGATVNALRSGHVTVSSSDGTFSLEVSHGEELSISLIGYLTKKVVYDGQQSLRVQLKSEERDLDEVVVVGYGTMRKEKMTGSVGSVSGSDLENVPSPRVDQSLQGRVTGVNITQVDGAPGAPSVIRIRGGNSIQGDNDPLFVVDGFIVGSDFNLNNINTNDIKSIDVLKDATAIAIYGTRGANGVILITTKSGAGMSMGQSTITFNTYYGMQYLNNEVKFLDGHQHAQYANEDAEFRGTTLPFANPDAVPNVNWVNIITKNAPIANADLSVSGRSSEGKVNYYVSGNYFNQQGIIESSGIERYNFRSNVNVDLSDKLKVGWNLNLSRLNKENNKVNFSALLRQAALTNRAVYDEDGNYSAENPVSASLTRNPKADVDLKVDHDIVTNLFGSLFVEYMLSDNLTIKSSFGPQLNYLKVNKYNPGVLPQNLAINVGGDGGVTTNSSIELLNENLITYTPDLGDDHQLDLLGGFTWQTYQAERNGAQGFGFPNDVLQYNDLANGADPTRNVIMSDWDSYQLVSWLGRANYQLKGKYLLTLVGRVDGSSRFSTSNNAYGFFPSAALAWRLDQEGFIENLNVFDNLKLRASYGSAGSQAIASFRSLALLHNVNAYFNDIPQYAVQNGRPLNDNLKWETTHQFDMGLDAAFFNNRLSVEFDFYHKITRDLLLDVQIPRQTGFTSKLQNLGSVRNKGLELKISAININRDNFQWHSALTLSGNRTKVLDLGGVDFIDVVSPTSGGPGGRIIVGQSVPVFVGVEYLGTWKSQAEIDASGQTGQQVGGPRFKDTDGDRVLTLNDFEILGGAQPDFIGGIQNTFMYKNFVLDVFVQGTYGNEIYNSLTQSAFFGRPESNKYVETLNRWTPDNPNSDIPRAGTVATLASVYSNSKMVEDGSHIRLKSVQLSYNLPGQKLGTKAVKDINLYFSGNNLLLLSNFKLFDPEVSSYGKDNVAAGFSEGEYPYGRTLTFGIKASF